MVTPVGAGGATRRDYHCVRSVLVRYEQRTLPSSLVVKLAGEEYCPYHLSMNALILNVYAVLALSPMMMADVLLFSVSARDQRTSELSPAEVSM